MNIHCKYDELIQVNELKPHPKNRNKHPKDQIQRLAEILKYQGIRAPIVVSNQTGFIVKGHGTCEAMRKNDPLFLAPIVFQDFESEEQEYAYIQSDNAIANWAELDLSGINLDLPDLGPSFNVDMLGLKNFELEPADKLGEYPGEIRWNMELEECHDYIVISTEKRDQFEALLKMFDLKSVVAQMTKNGNTKMDLKGLGRIISADQFFKKMENILPELQKIKNGDLP